MTRPRTVTALLFAALIGVFASGCDPWAALCAGEMAYYHDQCHQQGNDEACKWIAEHVSPEGTCW